VDSTFRKRADLHHLRSRRVEQTNNAFGERVRKSVSGTGEQRFVYGDGARLLHERGVQGTIDYVYLNGEIVAMMRGGSIYHIHNDHLGRPLKAQNTLGQTQWQAEELPFGSGTTSGSIPFNIRFPGQYYDWESGLHYNYYRYYDPNTGRYMQPDPIGLSGGADRFPWRGTCQLAVWCYLRWKAAS
jgi:RHS repeat-associated protein